MINEEERIVTIVKKNKKNISLRVNPNLEIILNIPTRITYSDGLKLIEEKKKWIEKRIKKYSDFGTVNGVYYLGKLYSQNEIDTMISNDSVHEISLEEWYQLKLKGILEDRVIKYSNIMALSPKKIRIKHLKSAWGICYSSGNITFNLNLIKMPLEVIDYLVIHELGHLKHPNHSKEYWAYIEKYLENPKSYRKWLKDYGYKFI